MKEGIKMQRLLQQFARFVLVGGTATVIDFAVLALLHYGFNVHYLTATGLAFVISTIYNYWASMRFVFDSPYGKDEKGKELLIFLVLSVLGLLLTEGLMGLLVEYASLNVIVSKVLVTCVVMLFNFITRKQFLDSGSPKYAKVIETTQDIEGAKLSHED